VRYGQLLAEESTASVGAIRAALAGGLASAFATLSRILLHALLGWLALAPLLACAFAAALGGALERRGRTALPKGAVGGAKERGATRGAVSGLSGPGGGAPLSSPAGAGAVATTPRRRVAFAPSPPASPPPSVVRASPRLAARRRAAEP